MALTVVSAIARLGEDPWEEARRLSGLPRTPVENAFGYVRIMGAELELHTTDWTEIPQ